MLWLPDRYEPDLTFGSAKMLAAFLLVVCLSAFLVTVAATTGGRHLGKLLQRGISVAAALK